MIVKLFELECPNCKIFQKIKRQAKASGEKNKGLQIWVCENCKSLNSAEIAFAKNDEDSILDLDILN